MFDYEQPPSKEKQPVDYTGLLFAAITAPVFLFFIYIGKTDMGLTVFIVLGMILFAIKIHWNLRRYVWFWVTIAVILALHVPLFYLVRWPQGKFPIIAYTLPIGIADFVIIHAVVSLAQKFFLIDSLSNNEDE